jgi:prepilin-type N-terminal cleavage/methylation domain-containing protein
MRRRGFTLGEVLIALTIMTVASAIVVPMMFSRIQAAKVKAFADTFSSLSQGIAQFKAATTKYPLLLSSLSSPPATTDDDICAADLLTNAALWRGPYTSRPVRSTGLIIGDYTILNQMRRVVGTPTLLFMDVGSVPTSVVDDLEELIDAGAADGATGTIWYTNSAVGSLLAAASGTYNLSYAIPINGC